MFESQNSYHHSRPGARLIARACTARPIHSAEEQQFLDKLFKALPAPNPGHCFHASAQQTTTESRDSWRRLFQGDRVSEVKFERKWSNQRTSFRLTVTKTSPDPCMWSWVLRAERGKNAYIFPSSKKPRASGEDLGSLLDWAVDEFPNSDFSHISELSVDEPPPINWERANRSAARLALRG